MINIGEIKIVKPLTNKQAIEILKPLTVWLGDCEMRTANIMAIQALEKQIPTKPIIEKWSPARCPSCGAELSESLGDGYYKHWEDKEVCGCGQLLDWGEGE